MSHETLTPERCDHGLLPTEWCETCDGDRDYCVADDSTECDCSRCAGEQLAWEHTQGWFHTDASCDDPDCACNRESDEQQ
jgi:hypothetical protein